MAKRAGFILCLVTCAFGVGVSQARADGHEWIATSVFSVPS